MDAKITKAVVAGIVMCIGSVAYADSAAAPVSQGSVAGAEASASDFSHFSFSLGMGEFGAYGNRGALYSSTQPLYDLAVYYWLSRNIALDVEAWSATDGYYSSPNGPVDANYKHLELGSRFYADPHAWWAWIPTAIRPFATVGLGVFSQSQYAYLADIQSTTDTEFGMTLGGGLHVDVLPQRFAVELLARWNSVTFKDTYDSDFSRQGIPDLTGQFVSWNANVMVTF